MKPSTQQQLWMYETMCLIRHYEDSLAVAYFEGKLPPKIQKGLAFDLGAESGRAVLGELDHVPVGRRDEAEVDPDRLLGTHRVDFAVMQGAQQLYGSQLGITADVFPGAGHITPESGYGPWPYAEAWCLDTRRRR